MTDRLVVAAVCVVLGLAAAVATSTTGIDSARSTSSTGQQVEDERDSGAGPDDRSRTTVTADPPATDPDEGSFGLTLPGVLTGLVLLALAALAVAVIARLRLVVRRRRRLLLTGLRGPPGIPPTDDEADQEAVADALDAGLAALESGAPRNAVVAAWVVLEDAAARAGVPREATDTATDLAVRMLAAHPVDSGALERLAALYREARFSTHAMTEAQRAEARACLARLRSQLGRVAR